MLAGASATLARRCDRLTMVARTRSSLSKCAHELQGPAHIHSLAVDWTDRQDFLGVLSAHVEDFGYPDLLLAWLYYDALGPEVVRVVAGHQHPCSVYQVRSSAAGNPAADPWSFLNGHVPASNVAYRQVVLGFRVIGGASSWLSNTEISEGVIDAIDGDAGPISVVGATEPWSLRP